jgi:hypothetical protein
MSTAPIRIALQPSFCGESEQTLLSNDDFRVSTFRFKSGVAAVRLHNATGELVVLPWQGQQIWSARIHGRDLGMRSTVKEPVPTREFLPTYGGFFLHCGALAMGVPGPEDKHPQHGELPNAPFQEAHVLLGSDEQGPYLALGGTYHHTVAFVADYEARAAIRLRPGCPVFDISLEVTNLRQAPMPWMYLAHANFRPVEGGRLVYSAPCTTKHVRVRRGLPAHVAAVPGYRELLELLAKDPAAHNVFSAKLPYNPEVCLYLDYRADAAGWAHSLQVLPDGRADYIAHRPEQLDKAIRWISNNGDEAALGLILPATAEPEGFTAEKAKGNLKEILPGDTRRVDLRLGSLLAAPTTEMETAIAAILGG